MGEGRQAERADPARTYATIVGAALILFGLAGFFYNSSFASGEALVAEKAFGLFYVNGWLNVLCLIAGIGGLALAPLMPRLYCLASGLVWIIFAGGGFFGAHGGEAIPAMGGLIPAGTANSLLYLLLGCLAFAAIASARASSTDAKPFSRAKNKRNSKAKVEPQGEAGAGPKPEPGKAGTSTVGRPRSAARTGNARRTIN